MENTLIKPVVAIGKYVIGTVLPYTAAINEEALNSQGWLFCDGRPVSRTVYSELFAVIGTTHGSGDDSTTYNLPDYRGYFLRGVDDGTKRDPDAVNRKAANSGGNSGDACGSVDGYYTAQPQKPFVVDSQGAHTHTIKHVPKSAAMYRVDGNYLSLWNAGTADTAPEGAHGHTIVGGDAETRPINTYVNFIIKRVS